MKPFFATLMEKVKDHPVARVVAIVALAIWGGGCTLSEAQLEPAGTIVQGIGAIAGVIAGAVVLFSKPKALPPQ
jgi:type IV secretory pathway VirB2 component (pilin)